MGTLLPRQRGTRTSPAACRHAATVTRASTRSLGTLYDLSEESISEVISVRLYVLSEHLGGRRVRGLIGPARIEPPVAVLQTTLVPRRHQLYPMRAPQRCAHAHARLRTVSQHLSRAPVFARTSSHASPHRHRARYGASQTTTCSQSVHRVLTECSQSSQDDARGGRCLWFWRLRRRAIRSREDQKRRGAARVVRGGESRRAQRFSVRRCGDGVA